MTTATKTSKTSCGLLGVWHVRDGGLRYLTPLLPDPDRGDRADWTISDGKAARQVAGSLGLPVMGVPSILSAAAEKNRVVLPEALARLQQTNFRASATLLREILERHRSSI